MTSKPQPTGAVAQMLAASGELDRLMDRGLVFDPPAPTPPPPPPTIREVMAADGPVDWRAENAERARRERPPAVEATEELPSRRPPPRREPAVWTSAQMRPG